MRRAGGQSTVAGLTSLPQQGPFIFSTAMLACSRPAVCFRDLASVAQMALVTAGVAPGRFVGYQAEEIRNYSLQGL